MKYLFLVLLLYSCKTIKIDSIPAWRVDSVYYVLGNRIYEGYSLDSAFYIYDMICRDSLNVGDTVRLGERKKRKITYVKHY